MLGPAAGAVLLASPPPGAGVRVLVPVLVPDAGDAGEAAALTEGDAVDPLASARRAATTEVAWACKLEVSGR